MTSVCHLCNEGTLITLPVYGEFKRVTSDCRIWPSGGVLCYCTACGSVQKKVDALWQKEAEEIYQHYEIYHQSGGEDQTVFSEKGEALARSHRLLERFHGTMAMGETGHLLDMGCGNGQLLSAFRSYYPLWRLSGTEINGKYKEKIEAIPGVDKVYIDELPDMENRFDLITMVHFLEHIPRPSTLLAQVRERLMENGLLLVQIPAYTMNPFDLLISDHCNHFSPASLSCLLEENGFDIISIHQSWIPKELTVVAGKSAVEACGRRHGKIDGIDKVNRTLRWLKDVRDTARSVHENKPFALFGTSIAATWLFNELNGEVDYFADEDRNRIGRDIFGKMVYHPEKIPKGAHLFIGLVPSLAEMIVERYKNAPFFCYRHQGIFD